MRYGKRLSLVIVSIMLGVCMLACGKKPEEDTVTVVYEFGDTSITYGEFYIYARTVEEDYQKTYGNGIWTLELNTEDGKSTVKDVTIRDIIYNINRVKVLAAKAEEMGIVLSDGEKAEAENQAESFYGGLTEKDIAQTEITRILVTQVIQENMLADKVYRQMISDYDFEISDEEARMTTFYDIVFECYEAKKDGTVHEYTDERKAAQLERANEALSSLAQAEDEDITYASIVDKYNLQYSSEYTMSRTEMVEEYGESVTDKILALSDGEVSAVIQTEYGYHIFKMLKANDEELTKKNKEEIVAKKQQEYFSGVYEEWLKKYDSRFSVEEDVDMSLLNQFPFTQE